MSTQTIKYRIRTLYTTAAALAAANPVLLEGELATESDTLKQKVGDGVTSYNALGYLPNGSVAYNHVQSTVATSWTINHNLGYVPSVEVFDSGSQEIEADVSHLTVNTTLILFTVPTAGFARLI